MIERIAIAALVGSFGFLIGLLAWWMLTYLSELRFGWRFYLGGPKEQADRSRIRPGTPGHCVTAARSA